MPSPISRILVSLFLTGCASVPAGNAEQGLYFDVDNIVGAVERFDWIVDRHEIEESLPDTMASLCQTTPATRLRLMRWLEQRIEEEGGSARAVYEQNGRDLGEVGELLRLERVLAVVQEAHARSEEDCPFWLDEDEDFVAEHGIRNFTLVGESVGGGGLIVSDGEVALGGGGGGRLLFSWGFTDRMSLATGLLVGAAASFPEDEDGNRSIEGNVAAAIPIVLRFRNGLGVLDLEAELAFRFQGSELRTPPGGRFSVGYGLATLREGGFMPHAILYIGYEIQPAFEDLKVESSILVGTRIGFNWDLFR
ncbi:MAG: hypothetical protein AAGF12_36360 [Myxococcota bacterium]